MPPELWKSLAAAVFKDAELGTAEYYGKHYASVRLSTGETWILRSNGEWKRLGRNHTRAFTLDVEVTL